MVSGSGDNTARIWDCDTGTPVHTLKGHTSWVLAVGWSPDDSRIATGSMDNTVRSKEHISSLIFRALISTALEQKRFFWLSTGFLLLRETFY
jgi:WD40 repeat protein